MIDNGPPSMPSYDDNDDGGEGERAAEGEGEGVGKGGATNLSQDVEENR